MKNYLIVFLAATILSACYDSFPGPGIYNAVGVDVELRVSYADGKVMTHSWAPGQSLRIGKGNEPGDLIQQVLIKENNNIIHQLSSSEVHDLIKREESHRTYSVWCVSRDSIYLFEPNPPDTGGCSEGKRVD